MTHALKETNTDQPPTVPPVSAKMAELTATAADHTTAVTHAEALDEPTRILG